MAQLTAWPTGFSGGTSINYTTPFPVRPGTRAVDIDGNEYVFCEFGGPVSPGIWVLISDVHVATPVAADEKGRVGVVCGGPGPRGTEATSDLGGWVQIYGLCNFAQTNEVSGASFDTRVLNAGKVVTSPAGTVGSVSLVSLNATHVYGAWLSALTPAAAGISGASDTSYPTTYVTLVTDVAGLGTGHTGLVIAVWLNYPYVSGGKDDFQFGNPTSTDVA